MLWTAFTRRCLLMACVPSPLISPLMRTHLSPLQATGCGKTHTISGSPTQPGIVFLIMKDLFARIGAKSDEVDFSLTVSYLEIYNETIKDLLNPDAGVLQLRDSQDGTATPAGLSTKEPTSAQDVVEWITLGNGNRTVNFTEANATSSRSHAVLRVTVTQKPKAGGLTDTKTSATLSVIDLAGSERASNTKNRGERCVPFSLFLAYSTHKAFETVSPKEPTLTAPSSPLATASTPCATLESAVTSLTATRSSLDFSSSLSAVTARPS
jgi:hypothetical protein